MSARREGAILALAVGLFVAVLAGTTGLPAEAVPTTGSASGLPAPVDVRRLSPVNTARLGERIFQDPAAYAPAYVGNTLSCGDCHLQAGRLDGASPMGPAVVAFPTYVAERGEFQTFEQRLQACFKFSMNGRPPPIGGEVLSALKAYSSYLSTHPDPGAKAAERGYPSLPPPALPADYGRGRAVFARDCAMCHGSDGAGRRGPDGALTPALWGRGSYNWGAGMAMIGMAANFIRSNMPAGFSGHAPSVQEAWDVAAYVDSHNRPQDPRFDGSVARTRRAYHDNADSMYGLTVGGAVLGDPATTPPAGVTSSGAGRTAMR